MMKKALIMLTALTLIIGLTFTGCSAKGYDFEKNDLSGYITLPSDLKDRDFKEGLNLKTVSEKDIEDKINATLKKLGEKLDLDENAVVEDGDTVTMDYVGKIDGKEFTGGSATDTSHEINIENSTFIDGFDKGMLGMKVGDTRVLNLKFPDDYKAEDLKGKDVEFTVTVDKIERVSIPELTDELVSKNPKTFGDSITTAQAYKDSVKKDLEDSTNEENKSKIINAAWKYILEKSQFKAYPDGVLDDYTKTFLDYYEHTVAANKNMHLKEYVKDQGYTSIAAFKEAVVIPEATKVLKHQLALYSTAKLLNISVTEDQVMAEAKADYKENIEPLLSIYAQYYGITSFNDYLEMMGGIKQLKENSLYTKTMEALTKTAK